jgi:hypothetical protein
VDKLEPSNTAIRRQCRRRLLQRRAAAAFQTASA